MVSPPPRRMPLVVTLCSVWNTTISATAAVSCSATAMVSALKAYWLMMAGVTSRMMPLAASPARKLRRSRIFPWRKARSQSPSPRVLPVRVLLAWEMPWLNTVDMRTTWEITALAETNAAPMCPPITATRLLPRASSPSEQITGRL